MLSVLLLSTIVIVPPTIADEESGTWDPLSQPWAQYGRDPGHSRILPAHGDSGMITMTNPTINWVAFDSGLGADGYGVAIANLTASITSPPGALERCGDGNLFAVMTRTDSGNDERHLTIIEGGSAKIAWDVNLGEADYIRSTPLIVDVDGDGKMEIALAYDTSSALKVDLWAPDLTCDESGWSSNGHSNERVWSWSDGDLRLGITSPHVFTSQSNHKAVTQPLLADLSLDGTPEMVLAVVDVTTDEPTVISMPLGLQSSDPDWQVSLDRGTHPSDPAFAALDDDSGAIVLTTVDANSGNMWIWRLDGPTGSLDWERVGIQNTDSDSDTPRLRLPGPVITQLDSDAAPEMILTLPVDENGATGGMGAQYIGMELTSTTEIWRFRAQNGYADSEPIAIDTTGNGITDRVCWATWYSDSSFSTDREGLAGCHDISIDPPFKEWARTMQRGNGNDNDEIAVAAPIWLDLDGEGEPELLVPFGRRIFAWDGDTGAAADISSGWSAPIDVPHRTWAAPAIADMDGDGHLDILVGDALISEAKADLAPLADGRGIGFTPTDPDPGEMVTITGQFSNIGVIDTPDPVDARILLDGQIIKSHRVNIAEAVAPSGEGGPITFSVDVEATLGIHTVELILDPNSNVTQTRTDNDVFNTTLVVLEPYVAQIQIPSLVSRTLPGTTSTIEVDLLNLGSRNADWTLSYDDSSLPDGWSFAPVDASELTQNLQRDVTTTVEFSFSVPSDALGSDDAQIPLTLTLDQDSSISTNVILPLEVQRTRGLSLQGPSGLSEASGQGRPGDSANVWLLVENLGNAQETTTDLRWTSTSWGVTPKLIDSSGQEIFSVEMDPSSEEEFRVEIEVPSGEGIGQTTSTTLTMCIGEGQDMICEDFDIVVEASETASEMPHVRTVPTTGLTWSVEANMPANGIIRWNMAEAGMIKEDWTWSTSGSLAINGNILELSGSGLESGSLILDLPVDAQPYRHFFNQSAEVAPSSNLSLSLHILQVFRTDAQVVSPDEGSVFNVSERTKIILRLENPGNGEDTFTLAGHTAAGNLSAPPIITFEIPNAQRTLGPGSLTMAPVWVTLPNDIPAREDFQIIFDWTSMGDETVSDSASITVQARPDHRWNVSVEQGNTINVVPGEDLSLNLTMTNVGNTIDSLDLSPTFNVTHVGGDASSWDATGVSVSQLAIYANQTVALSLQVPDDCWAGTTAELSLAMTSDGFDMMESVDISLNVVAVSGWRFDLSNTSLEVPPEGGSIELMVEQLGNDPQAPWFSKAGEGWSVELPLNSEEMDPGSTSLITVNVTPPLDAVAGEVGVIRIRISDGDGSGQVVEEVPVRVGSAPGIELGAKGAWFARDGMFSHATAWIENTGNDVAIMDLSIADLPSGWTAEGEGIVVVAPGEVLALPVTLMPNDWDGTGIQVRLVVVHPVLGQLELPISIQDSDVIATSKTVHTGRSGQKVSIDIDSISEGASSSLITIPETRKNITHQGVSLHLVGMEMPNHGVGCTSMYGNLSSLGIESMSRTWSNCTITADPNYELVANAWLRSDRGEMLDSAVIRLNPGENMSTNLSLSSWNPEPGLIGIEIVIIDSSGAILFKESSSHIARESGWNIGIAGLEVDSNWITISINRQGYEKLEGIPCILSLISADWSRDLFVDIAGSSHAPILQIKRPSELASGDTLTASISCTSPWDVDDDLTDDSKAVNAGKVPAITYESTDLLWTLSIAVIMVAIAWLLGVIRPKHVRTPRDKTSKKTSPKKEEKVVEMTIEPEVDDMSLDDISITPEPEEITPPPQEPEEEVIDIDDETASGRLSALRREISTDDNAPAASSKEDLAGRMDSFLKDR